MSARLRKISSTMAKPTPTSAAAMAITKRANTWPMTLSRKALKAIRLMLTALSISSIDRSTSNAFLRASTPYTPRQKMTAAKSRNSFRYTGSVPSCQRHRADEGGQQEDRGHFERDHVGAEDRVADLRRAPDGEGAELLVAEAVEQDRAQRAEEEEGDERAEDTLVVVE